MLCIIFAKVSYIGYLNYQKFRRLKYQQDNEKNLLFLVLMLIFDRESFFFLTDHLLSTIDIKRELFFQTVSYNSN